MTTTTVRTAAVSQRTAACEGGDWSSGIEQLRLFVGGYGYSHGRLSRSGLGVRGRSPVLPEQIGGDGNAQDEDDRQPIHRSRHVTLNLEGLAHERGVQLDEGGEERAGREHPHGASPREDGCED